MAHDVCDSQASSLCALYTGMVKLVHSCSTFFSALPNSADTDCQISCRKCSDYERTYLTSFWISLDIYANREGAVFSRIIG